MDSDEISTRSGAQAPGAEAQGGRLADEAKRAAQEAKAAVTREMAEAKTRATDAARQLKDGARHAGDRVATLLSEQTERQKTDVAESLRNVAQTMREAARGQPEGMGARLVDEAAWRLEDASSRLNERSVAEMVEDVARFGRRNPGVFLAGCLAAGFAAGRFLTSGPAEGRTNLQGSAGDDLYREGFPGGPAGFGEARPEPTEGFDDYVSDPATASRASDWATGGTDAAGKAGADVDDPFARDASDTRPGTGFPADAGSDERAPFGSGPLSEGGESDRSPARGGARDGGF